MAANIITIVGKSNSGKTTLLEKIVANLTRRKICVGTAKHAHEGFDLDKKGKDSWRHREAGAASTLLIAESQVALLKSDSTSYMDKLKAYLSDRDIIICEGFKSQDLPKIEIFRKNGPHREPLFLEDKNLVAFVTDSDFKPDAPVFGLDDIDQIADFIETQFITVSD